MEEWSFEELEELCRQRNIPKPTIYQSSLTWRLQQARFHAERAQATWGELRRRPFAFGDQRYYDAVLSYEGDVEACVQALHSMADILAQIINVVILGSQFSEHQVSIKKVTTSMETRGLATEVADCARQLLDSDEFRYIDAFCNTIKHRCLIHTRFRAEYGANYRNETGLLFVEFSYKGTPYPETWGSDILGTYRDHLFEFITNVGLSINNFLR